MQPDEVKEVANAVWTDAIKKNDNDNKNNNNKNK